MRLLHRCALGLSAAAVAAVVSTGGCSNRPEAPSRANPLDPGASGHEDPFALTARKNGLAASLDWNDVQILGSTGYSVYRGRDRDSLLAGAFPPIATGVTGSAYQDSAPVADGTSYYLVTVRNANGEESLRSAGVPFRLDLEPLLEIFGADGLPADSTLRRQVKVHFLAEEADSIYLSNEIAGDELGEPVTRVASGDEPIDWLLSTGGADTARVKSVYGRVLRPDGSLSGVAFDTIRVADPGFQIVIDNRADTLVTSAHRTITITLQRSLSDTARPSGADSVEVTFADTPGPFAPFEGKKIPVALPGADPAKLRVRVKNAFGWISGDSLVTRGDSLRTARILLNNSTTPAVTDTTRLCRVNVHVTGGSATAACLSTRPIPPCVAFDSLRASPLTIDLPDTVAGRWAIVYALLANEWRPEGAGVVLDSIYVQQDGLRIRILSPSGTTQTSFTYGDTTTISGNGRRATCGPALQEVTVTIAGAPPESALVVETAAPTDTIDVRWHVRWRVPESGETARIIARLTDTAGGSVADTVDTFFEPASKSTLTDGSMRR